jgi:hypothetical protein
VGSRPPECPHNAISSEVSLSLTVWPSSLVLSAPDVQAAFQSDPPPAPCQLLPTRRSLQTQETGGAMVHNPGPVGQAEGTYRRGLLPKSTWVRTPDSRGHKKGTMFRFEPGVRQQARRLHVSAAGRPSTVERTSALTGTARSWEIVGICPMNRAAPTSHSPNRPSTVGRATTGINWRIR